jgi:hypothetical protein
MNLVNALPQIFRLGWRKVVSNYEEIIFSKNCMLRRVSLPEFFGALVRIFPRHKIGSALTVFAEDVIVDFDIYTYGHTDE